ncbi:MAG: rod shape-determining protein MreC [Olegusella sp.]|nr:rod shape-determining protein MreC [Olegusella sp.]
MPQLGGGGLGTPTQLKRKSQDNGTRLAIVLTVVSLVLFTLSSREAGSGPISAVRSGVTIVTTPVRAVGSLVFTPFHGLSNVFANLTADQETLSELKERNKELTARNAELEEAEKTAERLQNLLNLQDSYKLQSTAARIIASSSDSWSSTVTIDKGTLSGVTVGMPVTDSAGVIGQTIECGPTSSVVRLLDDENSSVSAMLQDSRAQGMLHGSADGTVHLTLIGTDQTVKAGDTVVTSGLGGVFPKGLPLGTVTNVSKRSGALYLEIEVQLLSTTENYEEVLVITSLTEGQEATSEDIVAADAQDSAAVSGSAASSGSAETAGSVASEGTDVEAGETDESASASEETKGE